MAPSIEALKPAEDSPKAAPGDLNHIRRFVNTRNLGRLPDEIAEPDTLRDWLAERGLIDERAELTAADVRQAHAVREALRKLLLANNGDPLDPGAIETLNSAAKSAELQVRVGADGIAQLAPVRTGISLGRARAVLRA